jgi:hypothetical protein
MKQHPDLEEFLYGPLENVRAVAPATIIFVAGGTRRKAVSMGLSTESDAYAAWTRQQMIACFDLIFQHGVKNIFTPMVGPTNFNEVGKYREQLVDWIAWGLSGEDALADYEKLGWRIRLLTDETIPKLKETADRLHAIIPAKYEHTLWIHIVPDAELPWRWLLSAVKNNNVSTRQEAIQALYGEDVPPVSLYLGHGKPEIFDEFLPLLTGKVQCYWRQNLGYDLDEQLLRNILYDYAFTRSTWREDKAGRAEEALKYNDIWEKAAVVGLGTRLGPFWYPSPTPSPFEDRL